MYDIDTLMLHVHGENKLYQQEDLFIRKPKAWYH
jgi:hypothetical protein